MKTLFAFWVAGLLLIGDGRYSQGIAGGEEMKWKFSYDIEGRVTSSEDPAGRKTSLQYRLDEKKRLQKVIRTLPDGSQVVSDYDPFGRLISTDSGKGGSVRYQYDGFNRMTLVERDKAPTISYAYDGLNRVESVLFGKNLSIRYTYDFLGRLLAMDTPAGRVSYEYQNGQGQVIRTLPNHIRTIWEIGPNGSLNSLSHLKKDNTLLFGLRYSYRPDGLIQEIKESSSKGLKVFAYEYDSVQRLTGVKEGSQRTVRYQYNALGDRTVVANSAGSTDTGSYDWAGRLLLYKGQEVMHDKAGNLLSYEGEGGKRQIAYNSINHLDSVSRNGSRVSYRYDGEGNLIERIAQGESTTFVPDPFAESWRPLLATTRSGRQTIYIWEGETLLAAVEEGRATFFFHDHLHSVRGVLDSDGRLLNLRSYDPFGRPQQEADRKEFLPGFAGLFFDPDAAVYVTRARAYDPELGRFLQIDPEHRLPFGSQNDLSPYVYAGDDPINFVDRSGADREPFYSGALSWPQEVKEWEIQRQNKMRDELLSDIRSEATDDIQDFIMSQVDPYLQDAVGDSEVVHDIVRNRIESSLEAALSGKKITGEALIQGVFKDLAEHVGPKKLHLPGADLPQQIQEHVQEIVRKVEKYGYSDWINDTASMLHAFGRTSQSAQDVFRSAQGKGPGHMATLNASKAVERFRGVTGAFSASMEAFSTVLDYVGVVGRSMMMVSPPIYLTERTPLGLQGYGEKSLGGGQFRWGETLNTTADRWWKQGSITRNHYDRYSTKIGTYERATVSRTEATSPVERFMMRWFPLGDYYDPQATSMVTTTRRSERYQVSTTGGVGRIDPLPDAAAGDRTGSPVPGAGVGSFRESNLLITDHGINQYDRKDFHFSFDHHLVFKLPSADPKDPSFKKTSADVTEEAYQAVKQLLTSHPGGRDFEIRLVPDVNTVGYATGALPMSEAQGRADVFTAAFLEGIQKAKAELGFRTTAMAGSNAGRTFTHGILDQAKKGGRPIDFIFYDDAQVDRAEVEKVIGVLGPDRIGLFVERGGFHGSLESFGVPSKGPLVLYSRGELVSNPRVARSLAREYGLKLFYFNPPGLFDRPLGIGPGKGRHIYPVEHTKEAIKTKVFDPNTNRYSEYQTMRPVDIIRSQFQELRGPRAAPHQAKRPVFEARGMEHQETLFDQMVLPDNARRRRDDLQFGSGQTGFPGGPPGPPKGPGGASPMIPSQVGGVSLRGAGEALKHLGKLTGVAVDPVSGQIVLLSEKKGGLPLPKLRLDDIVTIFQCVYQQGESPSVSIDPDPNDPTGPIMHLRHSGCTDQSYPGWVLFEADRIMKRYSLGYDNLTRLSVASRIGGYRSVFDHTLSLKVSGSKEPDWDRFWIVPAEVRRMRSRSGALTLFDVPLKVNTQSMVWRNGKLEPAPHGSGTEATTFADWFTRSYDAISAETLSVPPSGCGEPIAVPVFEELRRIALIAAIAENLRDQNVPFPAWMHDHKVQPCPMPDKTPAIVVTAGKDGNKGVLEGGRQKSLSQSHIYGGVDLSPADKALKTVEADSKAGALERWVTQLARITPPLSHLSIEGERTRYEAVTLPGGETVALGANRLNETDLAVAVMRGTQISLTRGFHSFFQPTGLWGAGWILDLPRLEPQRRPIRRTGGQSTFKVTYRLMSPFGSYSAAFSQEKQVPELGGTLLTPDRPGDLLGLGQIRNEKVKDASHTLFFRDGRRWYFDSSGMLVAQEEGPLTVVYRQDGKGQIRRIEGWYGNSLRADILMDYDPQGRLVSARGSNKAVVAYRYDQEGRLSRVEGSEGKRQYRYQEGLVTEVIQNGSVVHQFKYNPQGQLLRERGPNGREIRYEIVRDPKGISMTATGQGGTKSMEKIQYDTAFRPVHHQFPDGSRIDWQYDETGKVTQTMKPVNGTPYVIDRSADGKREALRLPDGGRYAAEYDSGGRLTALSQGDQLLFRQVWEGDGRLRSINTGDMVLFPQYDDGNGLTEWMVTAPEEGPKFSRWMNVKLDPLGRPIQFRDYSGSDLRIGYDAAGRPAVLVSPRGRIQVERDARGEQLKTSWGFERKEIYDPVSAAVRSVEYRQGGKTASLDLDEGRIRKVRQFDGEEIRLVYFDEGPHPGPVKEIQMPNGVVLAYTYGPQNRVAAVDLGSQARIEYTYDDRGRLVSLRRRPVGK